MALGGHAPGTWGVWPPRPTALDNQPWPLSDGYRASVCSTWSQGLSQHAALDGVHVSLRDLNGRSAATVRGVPLESGSVTRIQSYAASIGALGPRDTVVDLHIAGLARQACRCRPSCAEPGTEDG